MKIFNLLTLSHPGKRSASRILNGFWTSPSAGSGLSQNDISRKGMFVLLSAIVLVAAVLRLWQIGNVPPSPDWDEAALGYNGYSIMQTGKDEYGKFMPVVLRSFDDYKPAGYAYLVIPFIKVLGLNIVSVRLPAVIFGILTVIATYFLVNELFKNKKLSVLAAFMLAISPWHIQFSRIAFEAQVGLSFNIFAILFFLKGLKKPWYILLSAFFMGANVYIYQSEKVFTPLLLIILVAIYHKDLFKIPKKYLALGSILGLMVALPMGWYLLTNHDAFARAKGVSIFSDSSFLNADVQRILWDHEHKNAIGLIFDNRRVVFTKEIISNYFSHFNLNWLFVSGDISRHHAPNMGLLYLSELPFLFIGLYMLFFGNYSKKTKLITALWFLITPIPAAITTGVPHAVRTINFLPLFQIFTALGIITSLQFLSKTKKVKNIFIVLYSLFFILNIIYYLDQYFVQQNYYNAADWQYGYAKIMPAIENTQSRYKTIIVSNQPPFDQSYMFFLFYLKYPPQSYQKEVARASGGFRETHNFGKYVFRPIDWSKEGKNKESLYIGRPADFPSGISSLKSVSYPNGEEAMKIVSGK